MQSLIRICLLFVCALAHSLELSANDSTAPTPVAASSQDAQLFQAFDQFFESKFRERGIPGAAFAIVTPEGIARMGTYGNTRLANGKPVDANTIFRLASVSKTFAAGLTAKLVLDGMLGWDDPITQYVPSFRIQGDASRITVRDVLGQSSGMLPHAYDNLIEEGWALNRILAKFDELKPICQPGSCYSYQNSVYSLVGPALERITQQSYAELVDEHLFKPLEMTTASVGFQPYLNNPNRAEPHKRRSGGWRTVSVNENYYRVAPAAGVNASVTDMARWLMAQMGSMPEAFSAEVVAEVSTPRVQTRREFGRRYWRDSLTDAHYGLGWRIYQMGDERLVYHGGWVAGFRADVAWSAKHQVGLVILLNAESSSISEMTTTFWRLLFEAN